MATSRSTSEPIRLGLLGLGTVGAGVVEILARHGDLIAERTGVELRVERAVVRRPRRARSGAAGRVPVSTSPSAVIGAPDIDIVVELIGGRQPALDHVLAALAAGQPVVTANKAIIAADGARIFAAAARAQRDVYFEAAVAGGIPIIRTLREGLASDRITEVIGILNGTTNFILDGMAVGEDYDAALRAAQALGYAEADPARDVEGNDAADKLAILVHLAFGAALEPDRIPTEGITGLTPEVLADATELGYRVKLLGIARRIGGEGGGKGRLDVRVHPALVPAEHVLANVHQSQNGIWVRSDALGSTFYQGAGAGSLPTGSAVVADLIEAARGLRAGISGRVTSGVGPQGASAPARLRPSSSVSAWYVRLQVEERPGVLADITRILARNGVSLATVLQRETGGGSAGRVPVVLTTHPTPAGAMARALRSIGALRSLRGSPNVVRIEQL